MGKGNKDFRGVCNSLPERSITYFLSFFKQGCYRCRIQVVHADFDRWRRSPGRLDIWSVFTCALHVGQWVICSSAVSHGECVRIVGGSPSAYQRSPQCISAIRDGERSRPLCVKKYSFLIGFTWYGCCSTIPAWCSLLKRSLRIFFAIPRSLRNSSNRRTPRNKSRRISSDHRSPITDSVFSIEHSLELLGTWRW